MLLNFCLRNFLDIYFNIHVTHTCFNKTNTHFFTDTLRFQQISMTQTLLNPMTLWTMIHLLLCLQCFVPFEFGGSPLDFLMYPQCLGQEANLIKTKTNQINIQFTITTLHFIMGFNMPTGAFYILKQFQFNQCVPFKFLIVS